MIAFTIRALTIEIVSGSIAVQPTDAIVNAANNAFWMGSGVAGAIKAGGGAQIETEAMDLGPVEPGECVVTDAGRLPARCVIHAAVMGQDLVTSADLIERATRCALETADARQLASISFPAFGTGVGGFPLDQCARIMLNAVLAFAPLAKSVRLVRFVLFGAVPYDVFSRVARELLGDDRQPS